MNKKNYSTVSSLYVHCLLRDLKETQKAKTTTSTKSHPKDLYFFHIFIYFLLCFAQNVKIKVDQSSVYRSKGYEVTK